MLCDTEKLAKLNDDYNELENDIEDDTCDMDIINTIKDMAK